MIAITFALPAESSHFLRLVGEKTIQNQDGVEAIRGKIDDRAIEIVHSGVGEKVCRQRLAGFLRNRQVDCLISAGFAGALSDQLQVGDLILAKNFSAAELSHAQSTLAGFSLHNVGLHTAANIIDSMDERKAIGQRTGAAAVDMETKFIAEACADRGIPMISIRAISDTPNQPFPAPPGVLFDLTNQRTNMINLAAYFVTHPHRIPRLIQFAKRIDRAKKSLAQALVEVVRSL